MAALLFLFMVINSADEIAADPTSGKLTARWLAKLCGSRPSKPRRTKAVKRKRRKKVRKLTQSTREVPYSPAWSLIEKRAA